MAVDFDALMGNVKKAFNEEKTPRRDYKDDRFVKVTRDENDVGSLVIRFIPDKNSLGVVTTYKHFGKIEDEKTGDKRYFIAECPTTIGEKCPYCDKYLAAWKLKDEETVEFLKSGKRTEKYISNVYVVKDPGNPDNNGKVMLYEYGYKIAKLIEETINGDESTETEGINIYHPLTGCNLVVKNSRVGKNIVQDGTKFLSQSAIVDDMEEFESLLEKTYDLNEFLNPDKFQSYEELEKKLYKYETGEEMPGSEGKKSTPKRESVPAKDEEDEAPQKPEKTKKPSKPAPAPDPADIDDDDDNFFDNL